MFYVYGLLDTRKAKIRYIGKTNDMARRYAQHLAENAEGPKGLWIADAVRAGNPPVMVVLEACKTHEDVTAAERFWIALAKRSDWPLTNIMHNRPKEWKPSKQHGFYRRQAISVDEGIPEDLLKLIQRYDAGNGIMQRGFMTRAVTLLNGGSKPTGTVFQSLVKVVHAYLDKYREI